MSSLPQINKPWSENEIQMYVTMQSRRAGLLFHADGNGNMVHPVTAGRKKLMGSRAGWPDMVYISNDGRVVWFELKTARGVVSQAQREVHSRMRELGCEVHVVRGVTGYEVWEKMKEKLYAQLS